VKIWDKSAEGALKFTKNRLFELKIRKRQLVHDPPIQEKILDVRGEHLKNIGRQKYS
jgi:hypothetical protein